MGYKESDAGWKKARRAVHSAQKAANSTSHTVSRTRFPEKSLSYSSFYRLCSVLTNSTAQPRASINYVTGFLVNDTFEVLAAIVDRAVPEEATFLKRNFDVVQAWLKYGHASKVTILEGSGCPRHDVSFGLSTPPVASNATSNDICAVSCDECVGVHRLFQRVLRAITAASIDSSAAAVVRDIVQKVELFMGHRLRVVNQQREIAKMIQEAQDECVAEGSTTVAVILIDFKMKAEPLYFRETTQDHFGKRGMSWHGVQVRMWELMDGPNGPELMENVLYYDQLSSTDNKQDNGAVISLLEATMMSLRRHLTAHHVNRRLDRQCVVLSKGERHLDVADSWVLQRNSCCTIRAHRDTKWKGSTGWAFRSSATEGSALCAPRKQLPRARVVRCRSRHRQRPS